MKKQILTAGLTVSILLASTGTFAEVLIREDKTNYTKISYKEDIGKTKFDYIKEKKDFIKDKKETILNNKEAIIEKKKDVIKDKTKEFKTGFKYSDIEKNIINKIEGYIKSLENNKNINQGKINGLENASKGLRLLLERYEGNPNEILKKLEKYKLTIGELENLDTEKLTNDIDELILNLKGKGINEFPNEAKEILKDINRNNWFYNDVKELVGLGGLSGYEDGTFRPNNKISFGEFLKLSITSVKNGKYDKPKGHWALTYYNEALKDGIIKEGDFGNTPEDFNRPISREDMSYIIMNINELLQGEEPVDIKNIENNIKDYKNISEKKRDKVYQAYKKGIIKGKEDGFKPKDNATRAEAATVIMRMLNKNKRI